MNNDFYLSIVIPAYNEEANLSSTLEDIKTTLKDKAYNYEIIIVDDGSTDKTVEIASTHKDGFESFTLLKNTENRGKGYSVKRGMLAAKGESVLFMDADNSTRIDQLDKLLELLNDGCDVSIASRRMASSKILSPQPLHRIVLGNMYIMFSRIILGSSVNDYNCGFKLYNAKATKLLFSKLTRNDWSFDSELVYLIYKYKLKAESVPVRWEHKEKTSKVKPLSDGIKSLFSLFTIRLNAIKKIYD